MPRRISPEMEAQIVANYTALGSAVPVARRLGVGETTVYRALHRTGTPTLASLGTSWRSNERRRKVTNEQQAAIAQRYAAGARSGDLAQEFGIAISTVREAVKRAGGSLVSRGNRYRAFSAAEIADMQRLWADGLSQTAIAQRFGTGQSVVSRVLCAAGEVVTGRRMRGERHGSWKGGVAELGSGYRLVYVSPRDPLASMRNRSGYVPEHRLVMARHLGRPLLPEETVHHINGDKGDNRVENLQVHAGRHGTGECYRCADCGSTNIVAVPIGHETQT